jgi:hypothetical protein
LQFFLVILKRKTIFFLKQQLGVKKVTKQIYRKEVKYRYPVTVPGRKAVVVESENYLTDEK